MHAQEYLDGQASKCDDIGIKMDLPALVNKIRPYTVRVRLVRMFIQHTGFFPTKHSSILIDGPYRDS